MRITRKEEKEWGSETTTTELCPSAHGIIRNAIAYRVRGRGSISGEYVRQREPQPKPSDGSIWGWAKMHRWTSENGYFTEEESAPEQPLPLDDE